MWNDFADTTLADLAGQSWTQPVIEPTRDDDFAEFTINPYLAADLERRLQQA